MTSATADLETLARTLTSTWERQQEVYIPHRERRFDLMLDLIEFLSPAPNQIHQVLDLACGPGSALRRILKRFPNSSGVAVDLDPFLLRLGELTQASEDQPATWIRADIRNARWTSLLPIHTYDAIVSTTALHWLTRSELAGLYQQVHSMLSPGGVFLNGDYFPLNSPDGRIASAALEIGRQHEA